ncbi:YeaH/YhbH family protein [Indioceanicola profundi]|uniref:YeaH/YhbH family protein n=1 Tax=Indioceanicola profundi TaxID=2220096 RepID=UPI000E6ACBAC|nr:YeaH/YhbH family protein [Indioceanicola profundi]
MFTIIDRRLNPKGKSLANRQRFLRRAKEQVMRAVRDTSGRRRIQDIDGGGDIVISPDGIKEPTFHRSSSGGLRDIVVPGNKEFVPGDRIPRPPSGGGGRGSEGAEDGGGEDEFRFVLSREEFIDLFLEDLELPDLAKRKLAKSESLAWHRAGYSVSGSPANLNLVRTMRNSLSRRIALKRPKPDEMLRLREEIEELEKSGRDAARLAELREELGLLLRRSQRIPYIDPVDVRYNRFESTPRPVAQAVMFCLMDVSGSMTEHMKDLAKRFYMLLYLFLTRRYKHVDVVFIRHTHRAQEVDEETFFYSAETGGTVVSTALEEMMRVVKERYSPDEWNIYAAQASDGDNALSDNSRTLALLSDMILPVCQYYAYIEVGQDGMAPPITFSSSMRESDLWRTYKTLQGEGVPLAMKRVTHRREIYPVFRELFARDGAAQEVGA